MQQDVPGLITALGGKAAAEARLDDFFAYQDLLKDPARTVREKWVVGPYDYYNQFRYNPNNEPDLHAPWMYALIGRPEKTSVVVRAAQTLFVNGPGGRHRQRRPRHDVGLVRVQRARDVPRGAGNR